MQFNNDSQKERINVFMEQKSERLLNAPFSNGTNGG